MPNWWTGRQTDRQTDGQTDKGDFIGPSIGWGSKNSASLLGSSIRYDMNSNNPS